MKRLLTILLPVALAAQAASSAQAVPQFRKAFADLYVDNHHDEQFVKAVESARCLLCHVGKRKKNHNIYGAQLAKLLDWQKDKKDQKRIRAALAKVAKLPSDPEDEESPTFGQLIESGKLPGGEPQKKDPPKTGK